MLVLATVVWKAVLGIVTGATTVVCAELEFAAGSRLAALGISSLPIVRPVTGSLIGSAPFSSHCVIWLTVGKVPNRS